MKSEIILLIIAIIIIQVLAIIKNIDGQILATTLSILLGYLGYLLGKKVKR